MSSLILPPDHLHVAERLRMAAVAEQTKQAAQAGQRKGVADFAIVDDPLAEVVAGDDQSAPYRAELARGLGDFQAMDGVRRKAFLAGMRFAVAAVRLASVQLIGQGAPAAAQAFRQLAAAIEAHAVELWGLGRNKKNRAR